MNAKRPKGIPIVIKGRIRCHLEKQKSGSRSSVEKAVSTKRRSKSDRGVPTESKSG
jgi:hypothetical protein